MPTNLVKSKQDEADWAEARRIVDKQYPDKSPDDKDKSYWKLTTSIYENIKKNRGKKQMQKQASVGELLAGQLRLRKQADDNGPRSGVVGRIGDKLNDWLGWKKRPRGWSNPSNRTPGYRPGNSRVVTADKITAGDGVARLDQITAGGHVDTLEYRGPGFVKRGGRWVQDPDAFERVPMPNRSPLPAPAPKPFPIPRGIRGPWELPEYPEYPENPPNDPLNNERIRRLVEGNKAPAPGGEWGERPINDNEIPLPEDDPGGAPAPAPKQAPVPQQTHAPQAAPQPAKKLEQPGWYANAPQSWKDWIERTSNAVFESFGRRSRGSQQPAPQTQTRPGSTQTGGIGAGIKNRFPSGWRPGTAATAEMPVDAWFRQQQHPIKPTTLEMPVDTWLRRDPQTKRNLSDYNM